MLVKSMKRHQKVAPGSLLTACHQVIPRSWGRVLEASPGSEDLTAQSVTSSTCLAVTPLVSMDISSDLTCTKKGGRGRKDHRPAIMGGRPLYRAL